MSATEAGREEDNGQGGRETGDIGESIVHWWKVLCILWLKQLCNYLTVI